MSQPDGSGTLAAKFRNDFVKLYLETVEDTESPRLFHVWSLLGTIGASLGRRSFFMDGPEKIYTNEYILLVGPPAVRKSSAIKIACGFLRQATSVRFAPDDTAGQRQGLITAMLGDPEDADEEVALINGHKMTPEFLSGLEMKFVDREDEHALFAAASEFASLIGTNNRDILTFLIKVYDGEDYQYRLAKTKETLNHPLLSILGATTPTSIADTFPPQAIGGGFMSRIILVYSDKKYKMVPRRRSFNEAHVREIQRRLSHVAYNMRGEFTETPAAALLFDKLYSYQPRISDNRFIYYVERRQAHLRKTAFCLAAARLSGAIDVQDVEEAHGLLELTEMNMTDALGEFGLSPVAMAKQRLVEFIRLTKKAIDANTLWVVMQRDMNQRDFRAALADLINARKLVEVSTADGPGYAVPFIDENARLNEFLGTLTEEGSGRGVQ